MDFMIILCCSFMSVMPGYKNYNTLCVCLWGTFKSIDCYTCYDVRCNFRMRERKRISCSPFFYIRSLIIFKVWNPKHSFDTLWLFFLVFNGTNQISRGNFLTSSSWYRDQSISKFVLGSLMLIRIIIIYNLVLNFCPMRCLLIEEYFLRHGLQLVI